ncbi:hypothetical protein CALCODRAFT_194632 [Calocera cornea HHB12733]|uniref:Uncharacterized protein n=1 Tax=Calocera cornea HHB12733 TaxID=1353952 RepID=A0A165HIF0_9BASI|nr:hypothetical protein CALCODRAFT_194632 [Calocera cornea HHB12733]
MILTASLSGPVAPSLSTSLFSDRDTVGTTVRHILLRHASWLPWTCLATAFRKSLSQLPMQTSSKEEPPTELRDWRDFVS